MREFRFGKNVQFDPKTLELEDKLFNADGNVKHKRDLENSKVVPKVMKLLKPSPPGQSTTLDGGKKLLKNYETVSSEDDEPDPKKR